MALDVSLNELLRVDRSWLKLVQVIHEDVLFIIGQLLQPNLPQLPAGLNKLVFDPSFEPPTVRLHSKRQRDLCLRRRRR